MQNAGVREGRKMGGQGPASKEQEKQQNFVESLKGKGL